MNSFEHHPLNAIASTVAQRLARPLLKGSQRDALPRFARGSNARRKTVASYTPAPGKASVSFGGFVEIHLSHADFEEIRGCAALVLARRGNPEKLDFAAWKEIFSEARHTLRLKRKLEREHLLDSLEGLQDAIRNGQRADILARAETLRALESERDEAAKLAHDERAEINEHTRHLVRVLLAARRSDASRRAKANFLTACRYLRRARAAKLGAGHAHGLTRTAAYEQQRAFLEYLAEGEERLASEESERAQVWRDAETAREMFAISA